MLEGFENLTESERVDAFVLIQNINRAKEAVDKANIEYNDALEAYEKFLKNRRVSK